MARRADEALRRSRGGVVPLAMAGLAGCALATATPPSVDVTDVRLTGLGLKEQQLLTTLCVTNSNATALSFRAVDVAVDVAGLPLVAGTSTAPVMLAPKSSTVVPFTVQSTARNIVPQLMGTLGSGKLAYRVHGTVTLDGALRLAVPFSRSGQVDLLQGGLGVLETASARATSPCLAPAT